MKKIILISIMLFSFNAKSSPLEVANNIYNEYLQVIELIKQLQAKKDQLEKMAQSVNSLSGAREFVQSLLEIKLRNWHPEGNLLFDPPPSNTPETYNYEYHDLFNKLNLYDLADYYGLQNANDTSNDNYVKFKTEDDYRKSAISADAYGKVVLTQGQELNNLIKQYLDMAGSAETLKQSTDIQIQITAQLAYNQHQMNQSMAMLLKLKADESKRVLAQERWYKKLLTKRQTGVTK
ncbi:MAG: type IV secretion system protein [Flavobacteriaceae bacterium]